MLTTALLCGLASCVAVAVGVGVGILLEEWFRWAPDATNVGVTFVLAWMVAVGFLFGWTTAALTWGIAMAFSWASVGVLLGIERVSKSRRERRTAAAAQVPASEA